ncbi:LANO_0E11474g1_1 [Lachancea nothofagi CBS 11611]|uniref:LANO_0E11474g1_1 n=1 Tax=Lachancea nothofagi CBS 11611 TaxID=1266666 RepID=A0A1G4JXG8_9SACH|nr:LANO_0E11474g1_1 [Lachancea nothofagi CBS 11611]
MNTIITQADLEFDQKHIWHPYASLTNPLKVYPVTKANGVYLHLQDGREIVDGMASWWCIQHGYNNPRLNAAAIDQINSVSHVMFGGIAHKPSIELCKKLVQMLPDPLDCVVLADSGSISIDVGMKMALQYYNAIGKTSKNTFLTIEKGFHGDAFGALSICDPKNSMHTLYGGFVPQNLFSKAPEVYFHNDDPNVEQLVEELDVAPFAKLLRENHESLAGVVMESIVQGAGGLRIYHPHFLKRVRQLCTEYDILLILDEVATGLGRTGKLFAFEHADIIPDIVCLGKALTGGYMTLSATISTRKVSEGICHGPAGRLMHGQTFMGNPLACAVANENMAILMEGKWEQQVSRIEKQLFEELAPLEKHPNVSEVRILGAIGIVEVNRFPVKVEELQKRFIEAGAWIRPFNKWIYIYPIFTTTAAELRVLIKAIASVLDDL